MQRQYSRVKKSLSSKLSVGSQTFLYTLIKSASSAWFEGAFFCWWEIEGASTDEDSMIVWVNLS